MAINGETPKQFEVEGLTTDRYIEYPVVSKEEDYTPNDEKRRLMCTTLCLSLLSTNLLSSMCAPFYPISAKSHGLNSDVTGSILGVYYATTVLVSPFMAIWMAKIGQANLLQLGLMLVGVSSLIFGGIDHLEDGFWYGVLSFILRAIQGLGNAATDCAVFAIASARFSKNLGKVNSYLNSCIGLSFMVGPPLGGLIYAWTNFSLPFLFAALLCFLSIMMVRYVFKNLRESKLPKNGNVSLSVIMRKSYHLFTSLRFSWIVITAMFGTACTSFLDPTLEPYLASEGYNNTAVIGVFFLVRDVAFTIGTPPIGTLLDNYKWNPNTVLLIGAMIAGFGYNVIGIIGVFLKKIVTVRICTALVLIGVGQAPVFSATLSALVEETAALGFKHDDEICGILAAIQSFAFYGGLWVGSVVSGTSTYYYGFPGSTAVFGTCVIVIALVHLNVQMFLPKKITYQSIENLDNSFP